MENLNDLFDDGLSGLSDDEILREYIKLDKIVKSAASERSRCATLIAQRAAQERGNLKTVHLETADRAQKLKCEFKTEWKVTDASEMPVLRDLLGPQRFDEVFKTTYTPRARAMQSLLATGSGDERFRSAKDIIKLCVLEEDKPPTISVEKS